jgi:hypothetical protein
MPERQDDFRIKETIFPCFTFSCLPDGFINSTEYWNYVNQ